VPNPRINTGLQSTSLDRAPGPSKNFVRGKSGYVPFWPGGLDAAARDSEGVDALVSGGKGLRTLPPGFSRGLRLPGEVAEDEFVDFASGSAGRIYGSAEVSFASIWSASSTDWMKRASMEASVMTLT
jgi:antiviral helicase SKI2